MNPIAMFWGYRSARGAIALDGNMQILESDGNLHKGPSYHLLILAHMTYAAATAIAMILAHMTYAAATAIAMILAHMTYAAATAIAIADHPRLHKYTLTSLPRVL